MSAETDRSRGLRLPLASSEAALLLVHLSVVAGFARLYDDGAFFGDLAAFVLAAHVLAVVLRRRRVPAPLVLLLSLAGAALAATWILFPSSTRLGLPTAETWDLAREALRTSRDQFERVAAPAPITPGFQLAAGLALYGAVWFADWAAFRLRATVEAVAPATVLFVFCAMLGSGQHRFTSALAFTAAVLLFVAAHRALRAQLDHAWLSSSPVLGPRAVLRAGAGLAVVGLLGGALVGPRLPGAEADALVRWRSDLQGGGDRSTVSPIVDLRKRLVNQTDTVLFRVRADRRAYWRLTSLDRFDGQLWSSAGQFSPAGSRLDSTAPTITEARRNRQEFDIRSLAAIWAPTAYQARSVESSSEALRWDPAAGALIVDADTTSDGLRYDIVSETPTFAPDVLAAAGQDDSDEVEERYEGLPAGFPDEARRRAAAVTAGAGGRYEKALALQEWFRSEFSYSTEVDAGHSDDALLDFLDDRVGYCEQFAGAYAAMARSLGMPSRVAVGFTPGEVDPEDPSLFVVRGKHAHAWPEVWFPELGWVPFEPTPGRGMPDAEYTGVPDQQDDAAPEVAGPTSTSTTVAGAPSTSTPGTTAPGATTTPDPEVSAGAVDGGDRPGPSGWLQALVAVAALAGLWLAALLLGPVLRRRRHRPAGRAATAVLDAWGRALAPVRWTTGLRPRPAETHDEFARRAQTPLGDLAPAVDELAALATRAAWDPAGATADDVARARSLADEVASQVREREGRAARLRRRLSWREAFGLLDPTPA